jgi:hypothetical protein
VPHTIPSETVPALNPAESVAVESELPPGAASSESDPFTLLGDLSDAISVVTVVHRSLAALEIAAVGDEETALRYALTLLRSTYSALDRVFCRLS